MKRTLFLVGLLVITVLLLTAGLACSTTGITASLGQEFTLPVGQTAVINGENLKLKFVAVERDSRCAKGVECIVAGEARCKVVVTRDDVPIEIILTQLGSSESQAYFLQYKATWTLEPYPVYGQPIKDSDYKLIMTISLP